MWKKERVNAEEASSPSGETKVPQVHLETTTQFHVTARSLRIDELVVSYHLEIEEKEFVSRQLENFARTSRVSQE